MLNFAAAMEEILSRICTLLRYDAASPMLFNTGLFMVLFILFIFLYQLLKGHRTLKMLFVIAFSLFFYYKSGSWCVLILCGLCLSDWVLGLLLGRLQADAARRAVVALNVVLNVGMLVYFKYFNLLADAFCSIAGRTFDPLEVLLPAGISFFTFRSISYIVDVYRRKLEPCHSLLDYTFFLTFFPPLLAGPVVRAKDMLPQIRHNRPATAAMISEGLFLIMTGLVKKVVIADYISGNFVDRIFDNPTLYSGFENLMGAFGFTIQIYCDFSGYSDMAIGIALLMGYRFKDNFRAPFKAQSPTEFWKRWHISLSSWLMDYVYIPLGGNRKGRTRQNVNLMSTMVIGGLWHGASWMYVIWGAYHGILLAIHKAISKAFRLPATLKGNRLITAANIFLTLNLMVIGMMIFRAQSLQHLWDMCHQITHNFNAQVITAFIEGYLFIVIAIVAAYMMHFLPESWTRWGIRQYSALPTVIQAIILALVLFLVIQTRQSDLVPFVYLQY